MIASANRATVEATVAAPSRDAALQALLEANQIGTFVWTKATGKISVSAGMERRFGLKPGDLSEPCGWIDWIDPADRAGVIERVRDCVDRRAESFDFSYRVRVPAGEARALEGSARLVLGATGQLTSIVGILIDATERHRRESALRAQQEQLRLVLKTAPTALVIFDEAKIIRAFSRSAEQMFGYTAEEIIGRNADMLAVFPVTCGGAPCIDRNVKCTKCASSGSKSVILARHRDESRIPIEFSMGEMSINNQRHFVCFCKDVSERLESEERLESMRQELVHVSRLSMMGEMAAGLAHEINQPLAATVYFLGAAELVLSSSADVDQGTALLKLASEQALRGGDIIRRMREFAARGSIDLRAEPINDIIKESVALALIGEARLNIEIDYALDPMTGLVLCDRVQIEQVMTNLLRNAIDELRKSSSTHRKIIIGTQCLHNDTIQISVADSGSGLDPKIVDHLYMPFVSTKVRNNVGIGLSICRRIIEAHGGSLESGQSPIGGAEFRFTLASIPGDQMGGEE